MSGLLVPGPQLVVPHLLAGNSTPLDCGMPAARRYPVAIDSLPSANTAIVGAASISLPTLPVNAAVASCTEAGWNTLRVAHGLAAHFVLSFHASMIASALS